MLDRYTSTSDDSFHEEPASYSSPVTEYMYSPIAKALIPQNVSVLSTFAMSGLIYL